MNAATPAATQAYFKKHPTQNAPVTLGKTGLTVSRIGFGGYRINESVEEHEAALKQALLSGCNLIDTSTNYTDGGSERLVGKVLHDLTASKQITREEIVVVTKVGYLQGQNLELARKRIGENRPFQDVVQYGPQIWHCIHPDFIEDQITRSLERMKIPKVDVLLLHNPEYFLKTSDDHREYYRRIRLAFEYLEKEVARGRIQFYGISSNTFPAPSTDPQFTSLEVALDLAREISPENHFAVVQFPFNLFEPGAALEENNLGKTVTELARQANLGTLINRPLNAFTQKRMIRLASFPTHPGQDVVWNLKESLGAAMGLETHFPSPDDYSVHQFAWGHILKQNFEKVNELEAWKDVLRYQARPSVDQALQVLSEDPKTQLWAKDYRAMVDRLFDDMTAYLEDQAGRESKQIMGLLDQNCPELKSSGTLSRKVIRLYQSVPGIDCVLLGMRKPEYVEDGLNPGSPISPEAALAALRAFNEEIEE